VKIHGQIRIHTVAHVKVLGCSISHGEKGRGGGGGRTPVGCSSPGKEELDEGLTQGRRRLGSSPLGEGPGGGTEAERPPRHAVALPSCFTVGFDPDGRDDLLLLYSGHSCAVGLLECICFLSMPLSSNRGKNPKCPQS
jgi:hypothetical protein